MDTKDESGNGKAAASSRLSEPAVEQPSESPLQLGAEQSEDEHRDGENEYDDGYNPVDLEVDSQDSDSALGLSLAASTESVRSSILESVEENGRTYHKYKAGKYYLPNDEMEQTRLDLQHQLFLITLEGKLHLAPVQDPQLVLDIGTGTGIWAVEYASQNPSAAVIGTDLSSIQPSYVPPNCKFQVDDAEDTWTFTQKFNLIHGRALFSCFKSHLSVFQSAFASLTPGGYLEMQDMYLKPHSADGTVDNTALSRWNEKLIEGAARIGRNWHCVPHYADWMREAGFVDVVERVYYWPGNTWPKGKKQKVLGSLALIDALDAVEAVSMAVLTRGLGMSATEVADMLVDVKRDLKDKRIHSYYPMYVVYGRKPL